MNSMSPTDRDSFDSQFGTQNLNPNNTELVLKGGVGEICVGGTYVAKGYLNNESLTQEKFIDYTTAEGVQIRFKCFHSIFISSRELTSTESLIINQDMTISKLVLEKIDLEKIQSHCIHLQQSMVTTTLASDKNEYISTWCAKLPIGQVVLDGWSSNNTLTKVDKFYNGHSIPEPINFSSFCKHHWLQFNAG
ncbi:hypothetical protein CONCODRAFT_3933 [Conidiobolus coronatus NRRL 28638]|uniref:Uncharacterized protein n=1 Tax=Conidiobolus coronatus (strain ATCC 28846 / CBS 209.66 / NRRL 28638) TaxID=796925 RepID=A0A137PE20_CONC2|nr:hypothetical protein CONCODRAFT_3933 [Conidiobolus coronatus NRRL 28638]|eukprot:KXN73253.1 hypothetical protein CONCODRAFT_3933 [Conidiobolus coronatus NRRL 28638]